MVIDVEEAVSYLRNTTLPVTPDALCDPEIDVRVAVLEKHLSVNFYTTEGYEAINKYILDYDLSERPVSILEDFFTLRGITSGPLGYSI
jgi:hypothetical protein